LSVAPATTAPLLSATVPEILPPTAANRVVERIDIAARTVRAVLAAVAERIDFNLSTRTSKDNGNEAKKLRMNERSPVSTRGRITNQSWVGLLTYRRSEC
jgi:hypothetical protein